VFNGDVLSDLDVGELWAFHQRSGAEGTIGLTPVDDPSRYGVVPTDDDGRVEAFVEKPPAGQAPTNWINAGAYVLEPSVLERIPAGRPVSIERATFPEMVADGSLFALHSDAYWIDAGTPATYLQAQLDLVDGHRGVPERGVADSAVVEPGATVEHAVVMAGAVVRAGATVRDAVLLPGARVGAEAVVERSVLGARSRVGDGAALRGLTVVGDDVEIEPGAVFDGARVPDEDAA